MPVDPRLDLETVIRPRLAEMEDSIIVDLFRRAQYACNGRIYHPGGFAIIGHKSFFESMLRGTEELHAVHGRYRDRQEHPFSENLPGVGFEREFAESPIPNSFGINVNDKILSEYMDLVKVMCKPGDDKNYGYSAQFDVLALQDISRRVHFGIFVAESKFQADPEEYIRLVREMDMEGILTKLTDVEAEHRIIRRVREKGEKYGVNPEVIAHFYWDDIIPLTKEVQIRYFNKRVEVLPSSSK